MRTVHNLKNRKTIRKKLRKSSTPHEVILWSRIRKNQLGLKFRRQHSIGKYIVDFYCPKRKLIIELDGSQHIEKQKGYDKQRDKYLKDLGFAILRFWDNEINNNLAGVLMKIMEKLQNNTSPRPSTLYREESTNAAPEEGRIFNKNRNISLFLLFLSFLTIYYIISSLSAHAADAYILENPLINGQTSVSGPAEYIRIFFIFGLGLVGITALFAIVFGGIRYSLSGSSETGKTEGKKWIFGAFTGIVLLFSSYLILNTINPDLVSLKNPYLETISIDLPENPKALSPYTPGGIPLPTNPIPGGQLPANLAALKANELSQILSYQYGGDPSTGRTDCSGAAERLRIEVGGRDPGRSTQAMLNEARASGNFSMDLNSLQPGDIIIRTARVESGKHSGTYIGNGLVWNSIPNKGFSIETLNSFMTRANGTLLGINKFH